ncbi:MAG: M1 family metallopeptidase [Candidatus Micrarchaeia archaeon]
MATQAHETLGTEVVPEAYSITLEPDLNSLSFKGYEEISVKIAKASKEILLNANGLNIDEARVAYAAGNEQKASIKYYAEEQRIALAVEKPAVGKATLKLRFSGKIGATLAGLYLSTYSYKGKKHYMLTTQFEAPDARRAFPCFDEPEFKAVFDLALLIDKDKEAISNMPVKETRLLGGKKLVRFAQTPRMSTYLLYIGVGEFEHAETRLGKLVIRATTTKGKIGMARLAMEYAKKFIAFYERYFGIDYPLPKVDLIAVPDFAMGAMENWGAITFRELDLLCDSSSPVETKKRVAITVAHELAHQWFGDLVTMKWWNDLWLNESFATFMSYKAVAAAFPEWRVDKDYMQETVAVALSVDALKSTHPISVNVNTPGEISSIFDEISYEKGGSVLAMFEDYVKPENFRKGLHMYLNKHAFGNATASDLWNAISEASGNKGFSSFAKKWIEQEGYPLLRAQETSSGVKLRQERYLMLGKQRGTWPVPVRYLCENGNTGLALIDKESSQISMKCSWIKLNYGQKGLYRTSYPARMLEKLLEAIDRKRIDAIDAWGLENDMFALARSGKIAAQSYLDAAKSHFAKAGYPANASTLSHVNWIYGMLYSTCLEQKAREAMLSCGKAVVSEVGLKPKKTDTAIEKQLRSTAMLVLGMAGDRGIVQFSIGEFNRAVRGAKINPDMKEAVYAVSAWNGTADLFNKMAKMYDQAQAPDEKARLLKALAMFKDKHLARKALAFALSKQVKPQDTFIIPSFISANPAARGVLMDWTLSKWKTLAGRYSEGTGMLGRFVENLGIASDSKSRAKFVSFFSRQVNRREDILRGIAKTRERIDANIMFIKRNAQQEK